MVGSGWICREKSSITLTNNFYCSDFLLFSHIKIHKSLAFNVFGETGSVSKREVNLKNESEKEFDHLKSFEDFTHTVIYLLLLVHPSLQSISSMYLPLDSGSLNDLHNFFPTAIVLEAGPRRLPRCFKIAATDQLITTFPAKMRGGATVSAARGAAADQLITFPAKMVRGATIVAPKPQGRFRPHNFLVKRRSGPRQRGFAALAQPAAGLKHEKQQGFANWPLGVSASCQFET
jgi:hypothetical protein